MPLEHGQPENFGSCLREWRKRRCLSQHDLSLLANISARHISFLEIGRANPSRNMVLKLAESMNISPGDVNLALSRAGLSPAYPQASLADDNVKLLREVIQTLLEKHLPWPAIACNQHWDLFDANVAALHLFKILELTGSSNVMQAILDADEINGPITNWPEVAHSMLRRLNAEQIDRPHDTVLADIRARLIAHPLLANFPTDEREELRVVVPIRIKSERQELTLISVIAQFGAVQEVTYSGMHVEMFFPGDEATEEYFRDLVIEY